MGGASRAVTQSFSAENLGRRYPRHCGQGLAWATVDARKLRGAVGPMQWAPILEIVWRKPRERKPASAWLSSLSEGSPGTELIAK